MSRFSTFTVDLALVGGDRPGHARRLGWEEFLKHWREELPRLPPRPVMSTTQHKLVWRPAWKAPVEWSTALWPDFAGAAAGDFEAVEKPQPLLRMALRDAIEGKPFAQDAFGFLLAAGVRSNVWPGHGATVISQACLNGHLPSMAALLEHGHDFHARLDPSLPARADFKESTLLHRVGPAMATKAQHSKTQAPKGHKAHADRFRRMKNGLNFLVRYVPHPDAVDAMGRSAIDLTCASGPVLAGELQAAWAERRAKQMIAQWGVGDESSQATARQAERWALKGVARHGTRPLVFQPDLPQHDGQVIPLRPMDNAEPGQGAVWLRAHTPYRAPAGLTAEQALELGRTQQCDAVVSGTGEHARWWVFHEGQFRPALLDAPAPRAPTARL